MLAAAGYPDAPDRGAVVAGIDEAEKVEGVSVFHAGTELGDGGLVASGGRVLNVSALGTDLTEARERCYRAIRLIGMQGAQHRSDIGLLAVVGRHV